MRLNADINRISCDADPAAITVDRARAHIFRNVAAVTDVETVGLHDAIGRVAAKDMLSGSDVPNHTNSAMDGYAYCAEELLENEAAGFKLAGVSLAGSPFGGEVRRGECVRIMTGAVMPANTDTVVMQERAGVDGDRVFIPAGEKSGSNVRYAGEDIKKGDVVIPAGTRIGASQLGLLASIGLAGVDVFRKPGVAYFSNGDELRSVGDPLAPGEVYDSNRYTLHGMLKDLGVDAIDLGVIKDDKAAIADTITDAARRADLIIATAGASAGDADYIKEILESVGKVEFWKVAIKPGRPFSFGKLGNCLFFGLPGNPVSVMVTFQIFLRPAIRQLCGETHSAPLILKIRTTTDLRKRPGRMEYQRGVMSSNEAGETVVTSTGGQGSGILSSMGRANCFIVLPDESGGVKAGDWVEVQPFDHNG